MPEHTGTATIHPYLMEHASQLNINLSTDATASRVQVLSGNGCLHSHEAIFPGGTQATFSFVANPFRRVLSNAAHSDVISGGKSAHANMSTEQQIAAFRHFVLTRFCVKKLHDIPHCIWVQSTMLHRFPRPLLLHPTRTLSDGFSNTLRSLGYPGTLFTGFKTVHCSATCSKPLETTVGTQSNRAVVHMLEANQSYSQLVHNSTKSSIAWSVLLPEALHLPYADMLMKVPCSLLHMHSQRRLMMRRASSRFDNATTARVLKLFEADFASFGFSRDPAHMFDERGDAQTLDIDAHGVGWACCSMVRNCAGALPCPRNSSMVA